MKTPLKGKPPTHTQKDHKTNLLPFNIHITKDLRLRPYLLLSALPVAFTLASIPITYRLFTFITHAGTFQPEDQPATQPYMFIYQMALFITTLDVMFAAYIAAWALNAAVARYVCRWTKTKMIRTFFYSDIPKPWKKSPPAKNGIQEWAETRSKGRPRYIITHGILAWGLPLYLIFATMPTITNFIEPATGYYLTELLICTTGGAIFAYLTWHISEKQYIKTRKARN